MPAPIAIPETSGNAPNDAPNDEVVRGCAVCPHVWADHDRIAARFCTATVAGKFSRGCVCGSAVPETVPETN